MSHPRKCQHDVYWPSADPVNLGCQQCNPSGLGNDGSIPLLPRSSSDALGRPDKKENCKQCGNIRTYFSPNCQHCGAVFPEVELRGVINPSNITQAGACPKCHSTIHYEVVRNGKVLKSVWCCADCENEYKAPSRAGDEINDEED